MGALTAGPAAPRLVALIGDCQGCGACLLTCPENAIRPRAAGLSVRTDRCTGCGQCVEVCPVDVVELAEAPGAAAERHETSDDDDETTEGGRPR
jgi:NAD-dependent dihydropyrimidine dehydrogenase PreA subunit